MKQLRTFFFTLAILVSVGASFYAAWKFACLELPHPMQYITKDTMPAPTSARLGPLFIFSFPLYWLSGIGMWLCPGVFVALQLQHLARWVECK